MLNFKQHSFSQKNTASQALHQVKKIIAKLNTQSKPIHRPAPPTPNGWQLIEKTPIYLIDPRIVPVPVVGNLGGFTTLASSGAPARVMNWPAFPGIQILIVPDFTTGRPKIAHMASTNGPRLVEGSFRINH